MITIFLCLVTVNIRWLGIIWLAILFLTPVAVMLLLRNKIEKYKLVTMIVTSVLCLVAVVLFFVRVYGWAPRYMQSGTFQVSGVVDDMFDSDGKSRVVIKDLRLDGKRIDGRMQITVTYGEIDVEPGYRLEFTSHVNKRELVNGFKVNASYLRSNIRYTSTVSASKITAYKGRADILTRVTYFIKNKLLLTMGDKYGAVAYGMLSGEKNEISSDVRDAFSVAGIAHILAVSGLHIGFLVGLITFILRKCKLKRIPIFVVNCVVLAVYCLFAGFSPSVVRACLMFLVASGATLSGKQRDGLNSLGFAVTVILTFSPLMLFEGGFIMSAGAVFAITVFEPIITRGLVTIKLPERVASAVSTAVSAQLGVLPATICFFESVQTYAIIVNIVMIPFMSVAFTAVFVSLIVSLIPPFKFLLVFSGYLIRGITVAANAVSMLPFASIAVKSSFIVLAYYPMYFVLGGFVRVEHKRVTVITLIAVMVAILLILLLL